jgi:DNA polymerase III subunit delta
VSSVEDFKKIVVDVRAGKLKPVYLLHGEEGYFVDRVCQEIEQAALQEHERDFNQTVVYARDTAPDQVKDACLRFPMMAERQLVMVREAQAWRSDQLDKLEPYFRTPTPSTVLVLCHKHKKVDGRKAWLKTLAKKGVVFQSDKLREEKLPDWIQRYTKHLGRRIGQAEARLLADHLGSDLSRLANEVEKLALVTPADASLSADLIERHVGISKEYNVFELQSAIGRRDAAKAHAIAAHFARNKNEHPLVLTLASLQGWLTKVALVHASTDRTEAGLAAALKIPPFFVKDYTQAALQYPTERVRAVQQWLRACDLASKGVGNTSAEDPALLQELLAKMMG